ncbi:hypothetical protein D9M71_731060 [compost metagenome]
MVLRGHRPDLLGKVEMAFFTKAQLAITASVDQTKLQEDLVLGRHARLRDGFPHQPDFIVGKGARPGDFFDLQVFLGVDLR